MKRKLRILQIIVQNKLRSGGAIQMFNLSKELVRSGHNVTAVYNQKNKVGRDFDIFKNTGIDLSFFDLERVKLTKQTLKKVKTLRQFIREQKFDIIHAHKGNAVDLVWLATWGMKIPIITNRGVVIPVNYFQGLKYRTNKIKRIVAVSQAVKDVMMQSGRIVPDKIAVVFGSIDIQEYLPGIVSTLRKELGIPDDKQVIGFVGNASPRKGLRYLLEAFETLAGQHDNLVLALAGVSTEELKNYIIPEKCKDSVFPLGFRNDVANCLAGFDLFVFPGYKNEGLTGTVREAAAMELPIVTTDVAGNGELIHHNQNGQVVPKKDSAKLAEAIEFLLENREKAREFGKNARKFVVENMSNEVRAEKIETIYYEALGESF